MSAVRRLVDNGDITGGSPVCQEGDADWLTLDDYWCDIMPPAAPAVPVTVAAASYAGAVHPALYREPTPVWKLVFGVLCFVLAFGAFYAALMWHFLAVLPGAVWMFVGLKLTKRK